MLRNCGANTLIVTGVTILLICGLYTIGYTFILKTAVPMTLKGLPLNQTFTLWTAIPLDLEVAVSLDSATATPSSELTNGSLAKGELKFKISIANWIWDEDAEVVPILWMEDGASLGDLARVVQVLSDGPINYVKAYAIILGVCMLIFGLGAAGVRLTSK